MSFVQSDSGVRSNLIQGNVYQPQDVKGTDTNGLFKKTPISMPVDELFNRCDYIILRSGRRSQFRSYAENIVADYKKNGIVRGTSDLFKNLIVVISGTSETPTGFDPNSLESALYRLQNDYNDDAMLLAEIVNGFTPDFRQSQYDQRRPINNISDNAWGAYNFQMIQVQSRSADNSERIQIRKTVTQLLAKPQGGTWTQEDIWALDRVLGFLGHLDDADLAKYGITREQVNALKRLKAETENTINPVPSKIIA